MILPRDDDRIAIQLGPAKPALAVTVSSSISSSTAITFNSATDFIRVIAEDKGVYLKWGSTAVTSSNFDEYIPAGNIVDLPVPKQATGVRYAGCTVIERVATATVIVIEK